MRSDGLETLAGCWLPGVKWAGSRTAKLSHLEVYSWRERPIENSISFVALRSNGFDETVDHDVILQCHAQLCLEPRLDHPSLHQTQHHHFGYAKPAKLRPHAHGNVTRFANARFIIKQLGQTNRDPAGRQATAYFFQRHIDIGQSQGESHGFAIDFSNSGEIISQ